MLFLCIFKYANIVLFTILLNREEWDWLLKSDYCKFSDNSMTPAQKNFHKLFMDATKKMFTQLGEFWRVFFFLK